MAFLIASLVEIGTSCSKAMDSNRFSVWELRQQERTRRERRLKEGGEQSQYIPYCHFKPFFVVLIEHFLKFVLAFVLVNTHKYITTVLVLGRFPSLICSYCSLSLERRDELLDQPPVPTRVRIFEKLKNKENIVSSFALWCAASQELEIFS